MSPLQYSTTVKQFTEFIFLLSDRKGYILVVHMYNFLDSCPHTMILFRNIFPFQTFMFTSVLCTLD